MAAVADSDHLLEHFEPRLTSRLGVRERRAETVLAVVFLAAAVATAILVDPERGWSWGEVAALLVCYAGARRVQLQVGPGYTVPTEVILVPLLFIAPLGVLPLIVMVGNVLSQLPSYASGRRDPAKLVLDANDAWYVF